MQAMKDWHKSHPHLFVKSPKQSSRTLPVQPSG